MNTKQVKDVIVFNGYAGKEGIVAINIEGKLYRIRWQDLLKVIQASDTDLEVKPARKYEYVTVREEQ